MRQISLLSTPNQSMTVTVDGVLWGLSIRKGSNCMFADINRNNETLLMGQRILPNQLIIPYKHLSTYGNFAVFTSNDECVNYERFNIDQVLVYLTPEEVGIHD